MRLEFILFGMLATSPSSREITPLSKSLAIVWSAVRQANSLQKGTMKNSVEDAAILRKIGVQGSPSKAPNIIPVFWLPPAPR